MLPVRISLSSRRRTICSEVSPSGSVTACCTTLPSVMVSTTSRTLACRPNTYSPDLRSARALERDHSAQEDRGVLVDHTLPPQQVGDIADAEARWNVHHLLPLQRARRLEPRLANRKRNAARNGDQDQQREDRIPNDHQRIARAPRAADRVSHLLRLQRGPRRARCKAFLIQRRADAVLWPPGDGRVRLTRIQGRTRRSLARGRKAVRRDALTRIGAHRPGANQIRHRSFRLNWRLRFIGPTCPRIRAGLGRRSGNTLTRPRHNLAGKPIAFRRCHPIGGCRRGILRQTGARPGARRQSIRAAGCLR